MSSQRVDRILSHLIPSQQLHSPLLPIPTSTSTSISTSPSKPSSGTSTPTGPLVLTQVTSSGCGHLILNRPAQLHSLTQPMIRILLSSLRSWVHDPTIRLIVIQSSTDKAFCAGGDIRALHTPPYPTFAHDFFREEYILDYIIATYTKPYVSILKGIVMGGGAGLSINGKYRIATDNTLFAMPETGIGLFTDVGGTHFLTHRCPGEIGMYLGLTGERIQVADTIYSGLASHYVPLSSLSAFSQALTSTGVNETGEETIQRALQQFAKTYDPSSSPLYLHRSTIDDIFGQPTLDGIFQRLQTYVDKGDTWAKGVQTTLSKKSPISLQIVFLALRRCRDLSLAECLRLEMRLATRICITHAHTTGDFIEGVRAVVIDKDNKPIWKPWRSMYEIEREYFPPFYPAEGYRELDVEKEAYPKSQ